MGLLHARHSKNELIVLEQKEYEKLKKFRDTHPEYTEYTKAKQIVDNFTKDWL